MKKQIKISRYFSKILESSPFLGKLRFSLFLSFIFLKSVKIVSLLLRLLILSTRVTIAIISKTWLILLLLLLLLIIHHFVILHCLFPLNIRIYKVDNNTCNFLTPWKSPPRPNKGLTPLSACCITLEDLKCSYRASQPWILAYRMSHICIYIKLICS